MREREREREKEKERKREKVREKEKKREIMTILKNFTILRSHYFDGFLNASF